MLTKAFFDSYHATTGQAALCNLVRLLTINIFYVYKDHAVTSFTIPQSEGVGFCKFGTQNTVPCC